MRRWLLCAILVVAGCSSLVDIDVDGMDAIPALETLDYSRIHPAGSPEYWEFRWSFGPGGTGPDSVIASGGPRRRSELSASVQGALNAIRPQSGFSTGCLPAHCFKYLVSVNGGVQLHATTESLAAFFGEIDTAEEAIVLMHAHGFYWDAAGDHTGMRETSGGWEFVVTQTVKFCAPVQTDRVRLVIERNGRLVEREREVFERLRNACV